jgi:hypothetical protein
MLSPFFDGKQFSVNVGIGRGRYWSARYVSREARARGEGQGRRENVAHGRAFHHLTLVP